MRASQESGRAIPVSLILNGVMNLLPISQEQTISQDPGKSMSALAKEMGVAKSTIHKAVHEDLGFMSYRLRRRHLLTAKMKESRSAKAHALINELRSTS